MICLDSDCIIDFLNGTKKAIKAISKQDGEIVTTAINRFEVLFGIYHSKHQTQQKQRTGNAFFDAIRVLPFDNECADQAAKILARLGKKGIPINQNDALISATMLRHGHEHIITNNTRDFSRVPGIKVVRY